MESKLQKKSETLPQLPPAAYEDRANAAADERSDSIPPGVRFVPNDVELVQFLKKELSGTELGQHKFYDVDIYKYSPGALAEKFGSSEEDRFLYFFTPRVRKYPNGSRPSRAAGDGYWKVSGQRKEICSFTGDLVGYKSSLVFLRKKSSAGQKTYWKAHEFTLHQRPQIIKSHGIHDMRLDDWVLCRMYHKKLKVDEAQAKDDQDEYLVLPCSTNVLNQFPSASPPILSKVMDRQMGYPWQYCQTPSSSSDSQLVPVPSNKQSSESQMGGRINFNVQCPQQQQQQQEKQMYSNIPMFTEGSESLDAFIDSLLCDNDDEPNAETPANDDDDDDANAGA